MTEKEKEKTTAKKEVEELRKEIEQKGSEIEELKKKVEELRVQVSKEKTHEASELDKMLGEVSEILDAGFSVFGISNNKQEKKVGSRGLIGLIEKLAKLTEESRSYRKEIDFDGKGGVIDFSIRTGPLTESGGRSFERPRRHVVIGSSVQTPVDLVEKKEPLVDVFDEGDSIKVITEIPGVEKDDVNLEVAEDLLTIKVDTPTRKYYKEVKLPTVVERETVESTYRNSILEVKLKKRA